MSKETVKVVSRKSQSLLVEWTDEEDVPRLIAVPAGAVGDDGTVAREVLDAGIAVGIPWAQLVKVGRDIPKQVEAELYRRGIWTAADLDANPNGAISALQKVYRVQLSALVAAAKEWRQ